MQLAIAIVLSYAIGSIPFGLLLTRAAGLGDIRRIGSGNIGATNVLRTGKRGLAAATLLLDGGKGALAPLLFPPHAAAAAFAAVVGHCAPVFLRFRGGKGVATGLGALLGLDWRIGAIACATWLAAAGATRRSSAAALASFAAAALAALGIAPPRANVAVAAIAILVVVRHHANIRRLLAGTEPAIGTGA